MEALFQLETAWWELVLRAVLVYLLILVLIRLSGKRTVGEFTPFDLIVVILLGEAMQNALVPQGESVTGPAIVAATLVSLNWLVAFVSARSKKVDRLVEGEPVVLARNGRYDRAAMRAQNVTDTDVLEAVRRANLSGIKAVRTATLETDGEITIVPKDES